MQVYAEPGGEYLIPWVRQKLKQWHEWMIRDGTPAIAKTIEVSDGAMVYVNSAYLGQGQFSDRVRITAAGTALRAWNNTKSIHAKTAGSIISEQAHTPADWSQNFKTYAYWDGTRVVLNRAGVDTPIIGSARTPDDYHNSFHQNQTAAMTPNGGTVVLLRATPSATKLFTISRWNTEASAWDTADVGWPGTVDLVGVDFSSITPPPYPPRHATDVSWSERGWYGALRDYSVSGSIVGALSAIWQEDFLWRVVANVPLCTRVFLQVRYPQKTAVTTVAAGTSYQVMRVDMAMREYVFSYDLVTGIWATERDLGEVAGFYHAVFGTYNSGGFATGGIDPVQPPDNGFHELLLDELGGLHVVSYDSRVAAAASSYYPLVESGIPGHGGGVAVTPYTFSYTTYTYASSVDVKLDGATWFANISVANPARGYIGLRVRPLYVSSSRNGALVADEVGSGGPRSGTFWKWGPEAGNEWTRAGTDGVMLSKDGDLMYRKDNRRLAYYRGVSALTLGGEAQLTAPRLNTQVLAADAGNNFAVLKLKQADDGTWSAGVVTKVPTVFKDVSYLKAKIVPDAFVQGA